MELLSELDWEKIIHRRRQRRERAEWSVEKRKENWWEEGGINTTGAPGPSQMKIQFQKEGLLEFMEEKKQKKRKKQNKKRTKKLSGEDKKGIANAEGQRRDNDLQLPAVLFSILDKSKGNEVKEEEEGVGRDRGRM